MLSVSKIISGLLLALLLIGSAITWRALQIEGTLAVRANVPAQRISSSFPMLAASAAPLTREVLWADFAALTARVSTDGIGRPDYEQWCERMRAEDVPLYLELIASLPETSLRHEQARLLRAVCARWLALDRAAAWEFASALPETLRSEVLRDGLRRIAEGDRAAAWALALEQTTHESGGTSQRLLSEVLRTVGRADPDWALARLADLADRPEAEAVTQAFFATQRTFDLAQAAEWIETLPSDAMQDRAWLGLLQQQAPADPSVALDILVGLSLPAIEKREQAIRFATLWAATAPAAALAWTQTASTELAPELGAVIMDSWARREPAVAAGWVRARSSDARYLGALREYAVIAAYRDPAGTRFWAATIPNAANRAAVQQDLARLGYY